MKRCKGSHNVQMLAWEPDDKGYPGAVICLYCSGGIQILKGSAHKAVSQSGHEGLAGKVKVHYVEGDLITYRKGQP